MLYPLIVILIVEVFSFGIFAPRLGFYHDDWYFLELMSRSGGFTGMFKAMAHAGVFWSRPMDMVEFPFLYILGGFNPLVYQAALLTLESLQGLLFFVFLERMTARRELSLAAAVLALMCPNRSITHVWFANIPQSVAIVLALASLISHWDWMRTRDKVSLFVSQTAYMLSVLSYESCAFLPLMLFGGSAARAWAAGATPRHAFLKTVKDMLPFAAALGGVLVWQRVGVAVLLGAENPKTLGFSPAHFFKALGAGFECVTNRILHVCWNASGAVFGEFSPTLRFLLGVFTGLAAGMMPFEPPEAPRQAKIALGAALGGFFGAYLPYALSATYMPQINGIMSRTNGAGALVAGLVLATGLCAIKRYKPRRALFFVLVAAFTWTNWQSARQYAASWSIQQDILSKLRERAPSLPQGAQVFLTGAPDFVGYSVVFDAGWDFGPALRLMTGRADLFGDVLSGSMSFGKDGLTDSAEGGLKPMPYGSLYVYDYGRDALDLARPPGL